MNDPRIGTFNDDGSVNTWPEVTITGRSYTRPVSTTRLSGAYFCVTDNDPAIIEERDALLAELRARCGVVTPEHVQVPQTGDPAQDFADYQASQDVPGFSKRKRK